MYRGSGLILPPGGHSGTCHTFTTIIIPHTHQGIKKNQSFGLLPSVVPSSPMMIFIEVMICWATGGDMEVA